jgi:hypothetical protein
MAPSSPDFAALNPGYKPAGPHLEAIRGRRIIVFVISKRQ